MPSINRIRVNNVKYNFGTQQYDDFTMRMYGKNTLYDLANGGGKSILMLLLLQNLIPNCTLDDKQPIEKLFRAGCGNTTIHSLIEWKLDSQDIKDGYRYMTTGFCARKAKDSSDADQTTKDTASIEYYNYCIFYREYNKNDIVNLPLSNGEERITFTGLRTYLKELAHRDMSLEIKIFDKKGEYQRFISGYGLHESHWEIIRGINKTEGHVRTYFETNYRTTRKVVEDLLIEEIIEKAFATKTGKNGQEDAMAQTLLDIKDKLNVLAQKKRDIAGYDHQIELINVLEGKVNSCMGLYEENDKLQRELADVFVTGRERVKTGDDRKIELEKAVEDAGKNREAHSKRLENLKVTRDYLRLEELREQLLSVAGQAGDNEERFKYLSEQIAYKESTNDYLAYLENERQYQEIELLAKSIKSGIEVSDEKMAVYAYNRKIRDEQKLEQLQASRDNAVKQTGELADKLELYKKQIREGEIALAVAENNMADASSKISDIGGKITGMSQEMGMLATFDVREKIEDTNHKAEEILAKTTELEIENSQNQQLLYDARYNLTQLSAQYDSLEKSCLEAREDAEAFHRSQKQLGSIMEVYHVQDAASVASVINERIRGTLTETIKRQQEIEKLENCLAYYREGKAFPPSEAVSKVVDYISTRHGLMAMQGADYLSALPRDSREKVLKNYPYMPYGVVTKNLDKIQEDINIGSIDTGNMCVAVYDMDKLTEASGDIVENVVFVGRSAEFFLSEESLEKQIEEKSASIENLREEISLINEKISTYQEDLAFVTRLVDDRFMGAEDRARTLNQQLLEKKEELRQAKDDVELLEKNLKLGRENYISLQKQYEDIKITSQKLAVIEQLYLLILPEENRLKEQKKLKGELEDKLAILRTENADCRELYEKSKDKLAAKEEEILRINSKWKNEYAEYLPEDTEDEQASWKALLDISDSQLELEFQVALEKYREHAPNLEDKKKLMSALEASMDRIRKTIEKRGLSLDTFKNESELYPTSADSIRQLEDEMKRLSVVSGELAEKQKKIQKDCSHLEGSIAYATAHIEKTFGEGSYIREDISLAEAEREIKKGDDILADLEAQLKSAKAAYDSYYRQQGYMTDLYKDVKRIVDTQGIDVSGGKVLEADTEKLRQIFETSLLKYDRSVKQLERAKSDISRFKAQTADTLSEMGVFEMANTIRQDVQVPDTYQSARELLSNLLQIIEFIRLEKERVEKGISDMVAIKENFVNQCVQRCMDVKTELEKLPKLSRITVQEEVIRMVDLSIPYVKEEFVKQRMSDYIDDIVKGADSYDDEKKRVKYIRECLGLKKLFGVTVTDMNAIKLSLYKRERIKEQSRYLKYEEAVGSTGQSQGIYIQFLVAIINYIAGMYSMSPENTEMTKTIFIDNPFGAAKDIYIWEPIFAMLAANQVQLIVPARGATPAITGRFDVNYILGQQMVGKRQQTVVVDYTSNTNQEELEYQELSYEQATFDFI